MKRLILGWVIVVIFGLIYYSFGGEVPKVLVVKNPNILNTKACIENYVTEKSRIYNLDREPSKVEIDLLEKLYGIENVFTSDGRYTLTIYIGEMFEWYEVNPNILNILEIEDIKECD